MLPTPRKDNIPNAKGEAILEEKTSLGFLNLVTKGAIDITWPTPSSQLIRRPNSFF
jgi:hypothetical protein